MTAIQPRGGRSGAKAGSRRRRDAETFDDDLAAIDVMLSSREATRQNGFSARVSERPGWIFERQNRARR
jgi:hypothetical protein